MNSPRLDSPPPARHASRYDDAIPRGHSQGTAFAAAKPYTPAEPRGDGLREPTIGCSGGRLEIDNPHPRPFAGS
jgi:hypothetical protein